MYKLYKLLQRQDIVAAVQPALIGSFNAFAHVIRVSLNGTELSDSY